MAAGIKKAGMVLGWIVAAAAWASCIGIIANYNIAPAMEHATDPSTRALIGLQVLCTILLSLIQIDRGKRLSIFENVSLSALLIVFNVWAGMDTTNRINEAAGGANADKISQAQQYEPQINDLKAQLAGIGKFEPTSMKQVEAAQGAVQEANRSKRACVRKCDIVAKERAAEAAQKRLDELAGWQAKTEAAASFTAQIVTLQGKLAALGNVPKHANRTAAQVASYIGTSEAEVEKWQPLVRSVGIEMINRLAPGWIFLFIIGIGASTEAKAASTKPSKAAAKEETPSLLRMPLKIMASAAGGIITSARAEPVKPAEKAEPDRESVALFASECLVAKPGAKPLLCATVRHRYQAWCNSNGKEPVTSDRLWGQLARAAGLVAAEGSGKGKRLKYADVALVAPSLRIVPQPQVVNSAAWGCGCSLVFN